MELTKSELEIMNVLWNAQQPLSRSDLLEHSEEKTWKDSSVHILLNGLLQKQAIREAGFVKRTKTYGRTFLPTMTREEYYASAAFCHKHQPDLCLLVQALLNRPEVTSQTIATIEALVEKRKQQLR